jgi:hypothetical protein
MAEITKQKQRNTPGMRTTEYNGTRHIVHKEENRTIRKPKGTVFIKTGEWVIRQPSIDTSTIRLPLLRDMK